MPSAFYFATQVNDAVIPKAEEWNTYLEALAYAYRDHDQSGVKRSNQLGWHSKAILHQDERLFPFLALLQDEVNAFGQSSQLASGYRFRLDSAWFNLSPPGAYNTRHIHPNNHLSGVYYIKVPQDNPGALRFTDPRPQADYAPFPCDNPENQQHWSSVIYPPIAGRFVFFPSWLAHEVLPNQSQAATPDCDRIGISMNYKLVRR